MHQFHTFVVDCGSIGNDNLNDTAFNQDTANTAAGINGGAPRRDRALFSWPWLRGSTWG